MKENQIQAMLKIGSRKNEGILFSQVKKYATYLYQKKRRHEDSAIITGRMNFTAHPPPFTQNTRAFEGHGRFQFR